MNSLIKVDQEQLLIEKKRINCPICNKSFAAKDSLKRHLLLHTHERPHACRICQKTFTQRGNLQIHLRFHFGIKPFECHECQKKFTTKQELEKHLRTHFMVEKNFVCPECPKKFTQERYLTTHLTVHSEVRPFSCPVCPKEFRLKCLLKLHSRIHTGYKPYKCATCQKQFSQGGSLKKHLKQHLLEEQYICEMCKRRFTEKNLLIKHLADQTASRSCKKEKPVSLIKPMQLRERKPKIEFSSKTGTTVEKEVLDSIEPPDFCYEVPIVKQELNPGEDLVDQSSSCSYQSESVKREIEDDYQPNASHLFDYIIVKEEIE